jgi:hypothetical protein
MNDDGEEYGEGHGETPRPDGGKAMLEAILAGASTSAPGGMLSPDSRHADVGLATIELPVDASGGGDADGATRVFVYLRRRFLPDPARFATLRTHTVTEGERLDHIAGREFNDPLAFWKLCDANRIMSPLDAPGPAGTRLRVPLPPGVPPSPRT